MAFRPPVFNKAVPYIPCVAAVGGAAIHKEDTISYEPRTV